MLPHGLRHCLWLKSLWAKDLITMIYRRGASRSGAHYAEAERHVWVNEVKYFVDVPNPVSCRSGE
jgi:hypothetical protein